MDLVERREIDCEAMVSEIHFMAVDSEARAVAFAMLGTVDVYAMHNGQIAPTPSFSLYTHARALCYEGGVVPERNERFDDRQYQWFLWDHLNYFQYVAIHGDYFAFNNESVVHMWNWRTKEAVRAVQYDDGPSRLLVDGILNIPDDTVDLDDDTLDLDDHVPQMSLACGTLAERTVENILCKLSCRPGSLFFTFKNLQTRECEVFNIFEVATHAQPEDISFQWLVVGSCIYMQIGYRLFLQKKEMFYVFRVKS